MIDGRTATSRYSERDIVYYRAKIDRRRTSAGKLRDGKHLGGRVQREVSTRVVWKDHSVLACKAERVLAYVALSYWDAIKPSDA